MTATIRRYVLGVLKQEEMSMTDYANVVRAITKAHQADPSLGVEALTKIGIATMEADMTGIERKELETAQAKLMQKRWERDHFSNGDPVILNQCWEPEHSSFGVIYEGEL